MTRKNISNYKLTSWSHLKLKFTVHFLKSPKQTGIVSISTFWVSGWTLCNSYSLKTPPTSSIGDLTLRTRCQSSKMPTAHLFLYLVDFGTALSRKVLLPRLSSGSETFLRPWQKQYVNHFKFTTLLEYKFGATRNYWIIKNKSSQIQWMPTEYNKSHIQGILKKNGKKYNTA